ncbi:unnamed protein product [Cylindrotheca closterium]|uniref:non-specific serine/threonine protein kinase n=1 Tax=Cylindrotheca closterium TaxID=2856 RepID=A0AAD2CS47_9STRA|nr:unnamed protein product [Cylindrotheca closterium]
MVFSGNNPRHRIVTPPSNPQNSAPPQHSGATTKVKKRSSYSSKKQLSNASSNQSGQIVIACVIVFIIMVGFVRFIPWKSIVSPFSKDLGSSRGFPRVIMLTESLDRSSEAIQLDLEYIDFTKAHKQVQWDKLKWDKKRGGPKPKGDSWFERHRVILQDEDTGCPFVADWQRSKPNPTCNTIHEIGIHVTPMEKPVMYRLDFLNEGAFKQVWQPHLENGEPTDFVLKTTFFNDYTEEDLLGDQQDGLVMERTTASNYVVSMFGYCHFTNLVQRATGTLTHWIGSARWKKATPLELLRVADMMAQGVKDMHMYTKSRDGHLLPTIAHADIKGSQYLETSPGQFRLNDFNRGSLLTSKDRKTICPFYLPGVHHKGSTMRAPEEYEDNAPQDDKIDVFSLGSSLYQLLTGEPPFDGLPKTQAMESIRTGVQPPMPEYTDPSLVAIQNAVKMCRQYNAKDRPWSRDVADFIRQELEKQEQLAVAQ